MTVQPTHNLSLADLDRQSFLHPFTTLADHLESGPRVITEGEGAWLRDLDGQRYSDAVAGLWRVDIGYGRLGHWFGSNRFGIRPDIMTVAKGLTSGYVPRSGSLINDRIWETIVEHSRAIGPFAHGYTYSAHPVAAAAAMANLDIIEGEGLVDHARAVGAHFQRRMRAAFADHPLVAHVRGEG